MHGLLVLLLNEMGAHVSHQGEGEGRGLHLQVWGGGGCNCGEGGPAAFPTTKLLALSLRRCSAEPQTSLTWHITPHPCCCSAAQQACGFDETRQLAGGRDPSDVPLLLAPVAFEGAALHRPPVKVGSV